MGKKIGQKLAIFQPNFCPQTTTSCGQTLLFLLFSTILHHYYTLNVLGEREHVHAHALRHAVSLLLKVLQVPDQCLWIAGDVDDSVGADPDDGAHEFFGAAASGGIHQDHIDLRALSGHLHEEFPGVVLVELDVADLVRLGIVAGIPDSIGV